MKEITYNLGGGWILQVKQNLEGPAEAKICREDGRFYSVEMRQIKGYPYPTPGIIEENGKFPCGQIAVVYKESEDSKEVLARYAEGYNGQVLELVRSSISKGEVIEKQAQNYGQTNPKRIQGKVELIAIKVETESFNAPGGGFWIDLQTFVDESEDLSSIGALAKLGFLRA